MEEKKKASGGKRQSVYDIGRLLQTRVSEYARTGEEGFSRYISNNVRSHTTGRGIYSRPLNVPFRFQGQKSDSPHTRNG